MKTDRRTFAKTDGGLSEGNVSRRTVLAGAGALSLLGLSGVSSAGASDAGSTRAMGTDLDKQSGFWPNGARLAVSLSLMFEAGGQPISGAGGVIPDPIEHGLPDLPTNAFFQYGVYEGIPRILDLVDRHEVKLSSFMIGRGRGQSA